MNSNKPAMLDRSNNRPIVARANILLIIIVPVRYLYESWEKNINLVLEENFKYFYLKNFIDSQYCRRKDENAYKVRGWNEKLCNSFAMLELSGRTLFEMLPEIIFFFHFNLYRLIIISLVSIKFFKKWIIEWIFLC